MSMDTSHSVCLNVDWLIFSITELNFEIADIVAKTSATTIKNHMSPIKLQDSPTL